MTMPTDYSAIEGATDSLNALLKAHITNSTDNQIASVQIDLRSPKEIKGEGEVEDPVVSFWLYRVARNADLLNRRPERDGERRLLGHAMPLDLHYLVTPLAKAPGDEQLLLGRVLQVMHDHAIVRGSGLSTPLAETDELRISLEVLSLEDLTRIWNALQAPYELSVSYLVQMVSIESHQEPRRTSRVLERDSEYNQILASVPS